MKTMTCKQLGGACDQIFRGNTFEEIAEQSKNHGMEMFQKGDPAHLKAMEDMKELMSDSDKMKAWMDEKRSLFNSIEEDNNIE